MLVGEPTTVSASEARGWDQMRSVPVWSVELLSLFHTRYGRGGAEVSSITTWGSMSPPWSR
jgi:hypothetical protein